MLEIADVYSVFDGRPVNGSQFVYSIDKKSTLFAVFDICGKDVVIGEHLTKELALIPDDAKLVITPYKRIREIPETLHVEVNSRMYEYFDEFVVTMLEVLSKRWQTMDLTSMMQEVQRTFFQKRIDIFRSLYRRVQGRPCTISDSLSSLPRLQKTKQTLLSEP